MSKIVKFLLCIGFSLSVILSMEAWFRLSSLGKAVEIFEIAKQQNSEVTDAMIEYLVTNPEELRAVLEENNAATSEMYEASRSSLVSARENATYSLAFWLLECLCLLGIAIGLWKANGKRQESAELSGR